MEKELCEATKYKQALMNELISKANTSRRREAVQTSAGEPKEVPGTHKQKRVMELLAEFLHSTHNSKVKVDGFMFTVLGKALNDESHDSVLNAIT